MPKRWGHEASCSALATGGTVANSALSSAAQFCPRVPRRATTLSGEVAFTRARRGTLATPESVCGGRLS